MNMIANDIILGYHDADLDTISEAIRLRRSRSPATNRLWDFKIGDKVRFNERANPKYLIGQIATVTGIKQKKIAVSIDDKEAAGRFGASTNIGCPLSIVEKVVI